MLTIYLLYIWTIWTIWYELLTQLTIHASWPLCNFYIKERSTIYMQIFLFFQILPRPSWFYSTEWVRNRPHRTHSCFQKHQNRHQIDTNIDVKKQVKYANQSGVKNLTLCWLDVNWMSKILADTFIKPISVWD